LQSLSWLIKVHVNTTIILGAKLLKLFWLAFKNQLSAQLKKPIEFFSSLLAIILNNSFYLYGIYLLAILSIGEDPEATKVYLISTGMVLTSWGLLNVFGGGLYDLGKLIETGELETFLAKPRSSLFLVSISKSNLVSLGEILQGVATLGLAVALYGLPLGMRALISSLVLTFAFAGVVILIGSLSFFSSRGSQLSYVLLNVILTLSLFPVARALRGREKWILYFTPLLMTATLPRLSTLTGRPDLFLASFVATLSLFIISILLFRYGLKRYKSKNYIFLNE
jgi:ABC-2 type transport system permease protein